MNWPIAITVTVAALATSSGCGRIGFSSVSGLEELDATTRDGGAGQSGLTDQNGSPTDTGSGNQGGGVDASAPTDAGPLPMNDAGDIDAGDVDAGSGMPDAGMPDSGRPDAGQPDAGRPDAGNPVLGCAGFPTAIACEDFEANPPSAPWQQSGVGTFTRVSSTSERGQYVGRFRTAPGSRATFRRTVAPLQTGDDVYMRAFIRVNASSAGSWNVLMQAETASFSAKTSLDFTNNAELNAVRSGSAFFSGRFPTRRWACIEAHFFLSSSAGRIDVSIDGSPIGQRTGINTAVPAEGLNTLFFGIIADSANTATLEVEYDDVVFSRSPIGGCG